MTLPPDLSGDPHAFHVPNGPLLPSPTPAHCLTGLPGTAGAVGCPGQVRGALCPYGHGPCHCLQQCARLRFQHRRGHSAQHHHRRKSVWPAEQVWQTLTRGRWPAFICHALETAVRPRLVSPETPFFFFSFFSLSLTVSDPMLRVVSAPGLRCRQPSSDRERLRLP